MAKLESVFKLFVITVVTELWHGQGNNVQGQLLSSTTKFKGFVSLDLAAGLNKYIQHETKRLEIIKTSKGYEEEVPLLKIRLEKLQLLNQQLRARKAEYDSLRQKVTDFHPTSAFRMLSDFLNTWEDKLKNETLYGFRFAEFLSNDDDSKLPTQDDLKYAAQALTEIQFVYNLSTSDIYAGNVMGHMGTPLKAQDAYEIALASMKLSHFKQAASWFEIALNNTPEAEMSAKGVKNASYLVADAMAKFGIIKFGMDEKQKGLELLQQATDLDPDDSIILGQYLRHRFGRDVEPLVHSNPGELRMHWFRLCANATSAIVAPLKWYHVCRYRTSSVVPYRVYREEILSRSPFISLLHRFLSATEARQLVNVSIGKLEDKPVEGAELEQFLVQGSVLTNRVPVARLISDRITDLTGMDTRERPLHSSGEPLHVLNYGLSGSFLPHYDTGRSYGFQHIMRKSGRRLATVLVYLSDVKAGGATAFPYLNITVTPETGKALLWYNISPSGTEERDILHAGCTVAVGAKWVASKGIWSGGNELRRPCGRRETSSHLAVDKIVGHLPPLPLSRDTSH